MDNILMLMLVATSYSEKVCLIWGVLVCTLAVCFGRRILQKTIKFNLKHHIIEWDHNMCSYCDDEE